jgi:hypothetical protein
MDLELFLVVDLTSLLLFLSPNLLIIRLYPVEAFASLERISLEDLVPNIFDDSISRPASAGFVERFLVSFPHQESARHRFKWSLHDYRPVAHSTG